LLYVGRLAKEKNIKLLPKVIDRLSEMGVKAKLLVAGTGPEEDVLRRIPEEKRIMAGYVHDRETLCKLKATADVLLFPSLREPFGLTPLEALASGCPVVAVDEGGPTEYSGSPAIRTVPGTAEAFATEVVDILKDDSNELRKEARKHARKYSWENTFEKQLALYRKLLNDYS
jgi:alpha-1,6-mannosyltransferase